MRPRLFLALVLLAAGAPPVVRAAARAPDVNVITAVEVKDEGGTVVLSVKGSKKPSFTTFSMADPPRFVIDFSESRFEGVAEDMQVQDGTINVVKNLSYGSDQTSIARVMIAFAVEVSPPAV
jgi:colicin import membrane protein